MASVVNISIDQGSEFTYEFQLPGTGYLNLTNVTPMASMRTEYDSANVSYFTSTISGANVTISMGSTETANLTAGTWVYDVILVDSSNNVQRAVQGRAWVFPMVTVP
jgi:hypothetical protein